MYERSSSDEKSDDVIDLVEREKWPSAGNANLTLKKTFDCISRQSTESPEKSEEEKFR